MDHGDHKMPMPRCSMHMFVFTARYHYNTCLMVLTGFGTPKSWTPVSSSPPGISPDGSHSCSPSSLSCFSVLLTSGFANINAFLIFKRLRNSLGSPAPKSTLLETTRLHYYSDRPLSCEHLNHYADGSLISVYYTLIRSKKNFFVLSRYPVPQRARIQRAVVYGLSTFLSFFLMLVFMTYNVRGLDPTLAFECEYMASVPHALFWTFPLGLSHRCSGRRSISRPLRIWLSPRG